MQNFFTWHKKKENIETTSKTPFFKEREIWLTFIGKNIGHEQNGGNNFLQPVLIVKKFSHGSLVGLPLTTKQTSKQKKITIQETFLAEKSFVLIQQIKLFSSKRLKRKLGKINTETLKNIQKKSAEELFRLGVS